MNHWATWWLSHHSVTSLCFPLGHSFLDCLLWLWLYGVNTTIAYNSVTYKQCVVAAAAADDEPYTKQCKQHHSRLGYMLSHVVPSARTNLGWSRIKWNRGKYLVGFRLHSGGFVHFSTLQTVRRIYSLFLFWFEWWGSFCLWQKENTVGLFLDRKIFSESDYYWAPTARDSFQKTLEAPQSLFERPQRDKEQRRSAGTHDWHGVVPPSAVDWTVARGQGISRNPCVTRDGYTLQKKTSHPALFTPDTHFLHPLALSWHLQRTLNVNNAPAPLWRSCPCVFESFSSHVHGVSGRGGDATPCCWCLSVNVWAQMCSCI